MKMNSAFTGVVSIIICIYFESGDTSPMNREHPETQPEEETSECGGSWIRANFKNGEMCYHVLTKDLSLDSCLHQDNYIAFVPNQTDGGAKQTVCVQDCALTDEEPTATKTQPRGNAKGKNKEQKDGTPSKFVCCMPGL